MNYSINVALERQHFFKITLPLDTTQAKAIEIAVDFARRYSVEDGYSTTCFAETCTSEAIYRNAAQMLTR